MKYTPAFWQMLLAGEILPYRLEALLREDLRPGLDPVACLRQSQRLTPGEKRRVSEADLRALEAALQAGAKILDSTELPEDILGTVPALFVRGNSDLLHQTRVAIVGTRGASTYGRAVATKFAEYLSMAGITVISGGALGVDSAAHKGAMGTGCRTAVVLGCGIDVVYPAVHRGLFQDIVQKGGLLISPYAAGSKPEKRRFVERNRLMASIAHAILVVEAPERSGALQTAGAAAELGRPVLVVPGSITHSGFRGSHALIRDGATLVDHPDQVLEALGVAPQHLEDEEHALTESQRLILRFLTEEPLSSEKLAARLNADMSSLLMDLTHLELEGLILRDGIGYALKP